MAATVSTSHPAVNAIRKPVCAPMNWYTTRIADSDAPPEILALCGFAGHWAAATVVHVRTQSIAVKTDKCHSLVHEAAAFSRPPTGCVGLDPAFPGCGAAPACLGAQEVIS